MPESAKSGIRIRVFHEGCNTMEYDFMAPSPPRVGDRLSDSRDVWFRSGKVTKVTWAIDSHDISSEYTARDCFACYVDVVVKPKMTKEGKRVVAKMKADHPDRYDA